MQWLKKFKRVVTVWAQIRFWSGLRLALSFTSLSHILIMGARKYTWGLICPFCNTEKGDIRHLVEESFLLILGRQNQKDTFLFMIFLDGIYSIGRCDLDSSEVRKDSNFDSCTALRHLVWVQNYDKYNRKPLQISKFHPKVLMSKIEMHKMQNV